MPAEDFGDVVRSFHTLPLSAQTQGTVTEIVGIELFGESAALIVLASGDGLRIKHPRAGEAAGVQVTLVAGRGFEPLTFRL